MKSKKVVVLSDLHCGHRSGLTPPGWQYSKEASDETNRRFADMQSSMWNWFSDSIKKLGKIDVLIINGDAIDGKGERSGSTELIEPDMLKQADMATEIIHHINAAKVFMTNGTPYHTGKGEDIETVIAKGVNAEIRGHHFIDINGVMFDVKHKTSGSNVPHGRFTAIARDALWNEIWSLNKNGQPLADVVIRSHVHYLAYCGDNRKLGIITPALQGFGSKYGERQCSGMVDVGFIYFDVNNGGYSWSEELFYDEYLKAPISRA